MQLVLRSRKSRLAAPAIALSMVLALVACGSDDGGSSSSTSNDDVKSILPDVSSKLIEDAEKEGSLSLYRLSYSFDDKIFKEFNRLFPKIKISSFEGTTPALMTRYSAEARSGRHLADVVMNSDVASATKLESEGLITHYTPTSAPEVAYGTNEDVWYPFAQVRLCNAYNSQEVSEDEAASLETWDGILDSAWKGKGGMFGFGTGGVQVLMYSYMYATGGAQLIDDVIAQKPLVDVAGGPDLFDKLSAGGVSAVFFANDGNLNTVYGKGAPIRWKCPAPALTQYTFQFIGADAPHPAAAKLWVEFMTSEYGQKLVMESLGLGPVRKGMEDIRPASKESWYKAVESDPWVVDWSKLSEEAPKIQAAFDEAMK